MYVCMHVCMYVCMYILCMCVSLYSDIELQMILQSGSNYCKINLSEFVFFFIKSRFFPFL
jgi:hypothetical protein